MRHPEILYLKALCLRRGLLQGQPLQLEGQHPENSPGQQRFHHGVMRFVADHTDHSGYVFIFHSVLVYF